MGLVLAFATVTLAAGQIAGVGDVYESGSAHRWDSWSSVVPSAFLELITRNAEVPLYVAPAPVDWVRAADLADLARLLDSQQPTSVVCFHASAHFPRGRRSTVGFEAARMIDAYRRQRGYPGYSCSDMDRVDPAEVRRWWLGGQA